MSTYTFYADMTALVADEPGRLRGFGGGGSRVCVTPVLDEPFWLTVNVERSYNIFGGCLAATIPCSLTDRQRAGLDLAQVEVSSSEGLDWSGFVWDKPKPGGPLTALGPNCGLAMGPVRTYTSAGTAGAKLLALLGNADACPTWLLPAGDAYRAWVADSGYEITAPNIVELDPIATIQSLVQYETKDWGWYSEWVAGRRIIVPHLTARSTTPDYFLALRDASQLLDGGSMEPLASVVRVVYNGGSSYTDVYDTDDGTSTGAPNLAHTLPRLGRVKWASITVDTTDSGSATTAGTAYLTAAGRDQLRASIKAHEKVSAKQRAQFRTSTRQARAAGRLGFGTMSVTGSIPAGLVRDLNGAEVPYSSMRPGQMLRLFTRDGPKDATLREIVLRDREATLTLDNSPDRMDMTVARLAMKAKR